MEGQRILLGLGCGCIDHHLIRIQILVGMLRGHRLGEHHFADRCRSQGWRIKLSLRPLCIVRLSVLRGFVVVFVQQHLVGILRPILLIIVIGLLAFSSVNHRSSLFFVRLVVSLLLLSLPLFICFHLLLGLTVGHLDLDLDLLFDFFPLPLVIMTSVEFGRGTTIGRLQFVLPDHHFVCVVFTAILVGHALIGAGETCLQTLRSSSHLQLVLVHILDVWLFVDGFVVIVLLCCRFLRDQVLLLLPLTGRLHLGEMCLLLFGTGTLILLLLFVRLLIHARSGTEIQSGELIQGAELRMRLLRLFVVRIEKQEGTVHPKTTWVHTKAVLVASAILLIPIAQY
mmetsp:Transcript_14088/g.42425  ORF Transcript_14088/g.42425 Transcript_14088/m.42425 type:complete len:340 (+) Transcript_14088:2400-3419(+)